MLEEKAAMNMNLTTCEQGMDGTKGGGFYNGRGVAFHIV